MLLSLLQACVSPTHVENENREPAAISKVGGDDYEMETCGLSRNEKFKILKNGSDINRGGRTDASGCVKTTFRNGVVKPGDNLVIVINDKNQASETIPSGGSSGNGGGGNNGGHKPSPAPSPAPIQSLPSVDLGAVRDTAENNARCMANAVVEGYGRMERYRYNFQKGLRQGIYIYNWSNLGELRTTSDYIRGAQDGEARGSSEGLVQGRQAGASEGQSYGSSAARRSFSAAVDTGAAPNLDNTPPSPSYQGSRSAVPSPRTVEERIGALNGEVQSWLRSVDFAYDGWQWDPWGDYWSPAKLYSINNYDFELVRSWYRDDWAWNLWRQKSFSRCKNQVGYYDKISDSSQTKNSQDAERTFRSRFKSEYDNVIGEKWAKAVRRDEPAAFDFGRSMGVRVSQDYARELGYYNSYSTSYSATSINGYHETYASGYRNGFDTSKKLYENSSVLDDMTAEIKAANGRSFGVGTAINVNLKSVKNIGRQPAEPKVTLSGNVFAATTKKFKMGYSESLKEPQVFTAIAFVGTGGAPNQNSQVTLKVDSLSQDFNINSDWSETIQNIATTSPEVSKAIVDYMKYHLALEWKDVKSGLGSNKYKTPLSDTLLEKLADSYNQGNADLKGKLKPKLSELRSTLGERPGFIYFDDRAKWDSANKIYESTK